MQVLTLQRIKTLCGAITFMKGENYYQQGYVQSLQLKNEDDGRKYVATVEESESYMVQIRIFDDSEIEAECGCPASSSFNPYCKHTAAVLLEIMDEEKREEDHLRSRRARILPLPTSTVTSQDVRLTSGLISLFEKTAQMERMKANQTAILENKETLNVEFICKITNEYMPDPKFKIEIKIGLKRLYVVQNIRQFLRHVEERRIFAFTKLFTYDPSLHKFKNEDSALIKLLQQTYNSEFAYDESGRNYPGFTATGNQRLLTIPPLAWNAILPLLAKAGTQIERENGTLAIMEICDERLPIRFDLSSGNEDAYQLEIKGIKKVIVMAAYGCALHEGRIYNLQERELVLLSEMKNLLYRFNLPQIQISAQQMDDFMEKVVPGLRRLGKVEIDSSIRDLMIQPTLTAKLYLDRDEAALFAKLEFVYDGIVIEALSAEAGRYRQHDVILIRDTEKERRILDVIQNTELMHNGREFEMDLSEEDSIYQILYQMLPKLESWVEVYATPAVKQMMHNPQQQPTVKADTDHTMNWLEISFDMEGIREKEIRELLISVVEKKKYARLSNGEYLSLEQDSFQTFAQLYDELGMRKTDIRGSRMNLPMVRALQLTDENGLRAGISVGKMLRQMLDHMAHPEHMEFIIPQELSSVLRKYQIQGYQWLKTLGFYGFGGILADDMGLGKTIQSIAYILSETRDREACQPVLIVSPASLVYNWENEFERFSPELKVQVALGTRAERNLILSKLTQAGGTNEMINKDDSTYVDVIITSYPSLRQDIELYRGLTFSTLFLDEAQAFKNHASQTAQAVKDISAGRRFALTGTPIENSIEELWSIFDAVFPGLFGGKKAFRDLPRERIARIVQPFIMRRMRADVLPELPERIETIQHSELTKEQKKLYVTYMAEFKQETMKNLRREGFQKSRMKILAGITRLRQICCHPTLFIDDYQGSSGKLQQLLEIVEECLDSGKRMLIFSQFTSMLRIIRNELAERGIPAFYLDGQTPSRERVEMCSRYNNGEHDIFLISLKAGGTGLNLTGADTVILYDLWWNPAVEEQAAGRAHRMGQKNVVQVIRLVSKGTMEEKMLELQQKKKDLIREVMEPSDDHGTSLSEQEIKELLMLGEVN
ncbi:DEAD/DEAH box helicase [Paenibacillus pini]